MGPWHQKRIGKGHLFVLLKKRPIFRRFLLFTEAHDEDKQRRDGDTEAVLIFCRPGVVFFSLCLFAIWFYLKPRVRQTKDIFLGFGKKACASPGQSLHKTGPRGSGRASEARTEHRQVNTTATGMATGFCQWPVKPLPLSSDEKTLKFYVK